MNRVIYGCRRCNDLAHLQLYLCYPQEPGLQSGQVAQWFSALVAMVMLSAKTWVRVPSMTSGVFLL